MCGVFHHSTQIVCFTKGLCFFDLLGLRARRRGKERFVLDYKASRWESCSTNVFLFIYYLFVCLCLQVVLEGEVFDSLTQSKIFATETRA